MRKSGNVSVVAVFFTLILLTFWLGIPAAFRWTSRRLWKVWVGVAVFVLTVWLGNLGTFWNIPKVVAWMVGGTVGLSVSMFAIVFVFLGYRAWRAAWETYLFERSKQLGSF